MSDLFDLLNQVMFKWQLLVNMIMPQNLPASCCNCTGSDILLIRISAKFDLDLCVTFLNFQAGSVWKCLMNTITA